MRASELIGRPVYDPDGRGLGRVHDIRIKAGGPADAQGEAGYRICGLTIGPVAVAQRLGYGRGQMAGPWPLTVIFRSLARHSLLVDWDDVVGLRPGRVDIRKRREELSSVEDADASTPDHRGEPSS